jgi:sugar phosphate isomerase/epimerase
MKTIKGPAIFLAQFAGDAAPFNSLAGIAGWAAGHGYKGVQLPSWDARLFDLKRAAESTGYCDEVKGVLSAAGVELTELSTHLQGQLVAVHPAYDAAFDGFAAPEVRGNPAARREWAVNQLQLAAKASRNLGLKAHVTFSGGLAWPFVYPWPQRPAGLVETAFDELARRCTPILNAFDRGVNCISGSTSAGCRLRIVSDRRKDRWPATEGFRSTYGNTRPGDSLHRSAAIS